jgi:hypothetical protein
MEQPMTEDQIERVVELFADRTDARFMAGKMTQAEYDAANRKVAAWADEQYRKPPVLRTLSGLRS